MKTIFNSTWSYSILLGFLCFSCDLDIPALQCEGSIPLDKRESVSREVLEWRLFFDEREFYKLSFILGTDSLYNRSLESFSVCGFDFLYPSSAIEIKNFLDERKERIELILTVNGKFPDESEAVQYELAPINPANFYLKEYKAIGSITSWLFTNKEPAASLSKKFSLSYVFWIYREENDWIIESVIPMDSNNRMEEVVQNLLVESFIETGHKVGVSKIVCNFDRLD